MAYLKPLYRRNCEDCDNFATQILCNRFNEELNYYCTAHAGRHLASEKANERAREPKPQPGAAP